jgi:type IV pilus assembly protein PilF
MRCSNFLMLLFVCAVATAGCGASEATEKAIRKSERFYEAASISWYDEGNVLAAIRNLVRSIETNPKNDQAHYLLGIIRLSRNELDEAQKHLRETIRLRTDRDPAGLAGAQNNLGVVLIHQKRYAEAIEVLQASAAEVMNREPWLAYGNLGWAYIETGEYEKAVEVLKRAMFDQPKYCVGLFRMGQAQYLKHDYEAAESSLRKAISIEEPGCNQIQEAYHLLGMACIREEKIEEAKAALVRCEEIDEVSIIGLKCAKARNGL